LDKWKDLNRPENKIFDEKKEKSSFSMALSILTKKDLSVIHIGNKYYYEDESSIDTESVF